MFSDDSSRQNSLYVTMFSDTTSRQNSLYVMQCLVITDY